MELLAALVGLVVGLVVGLTSMGGGALLTPALVLVLGIPPSVAVGSDVLIASGMKLFGGGAYALKKQVHWPTVWKLAAGSIPGSILGVLILNRIPPALLDGVVTRGLGVALLLAAIATVRRLLRKEHVEAGGWPSLPATIALGFATGLLVSSTSVGSGSLLICVLFQFFPLKTTTAVGTDIVHALVLSIVATIGHGLSGRVDLALAGSVLLGAIPGVLLGARVAGIVPERALRTGLAVVLVVIGVRLTLGVTQRPEVVQLAKAEVLR